MRLATGVMPTSTAFGEAWTRCGVDSNVRNGDACVEPEVRGRAAASGERSKPELGEAAVEAGGDAAAPPKVNTGLVGVSGSAEPSAERLKLGLCVEDAGEDGNDAADGVEACVSHSR